MSGDQELAGTGALVTGGGSGIGLAIARRLATDGATVTICGRTEARLVEAVESVGPIEGAGSLHPRVADVSDEDAVAVSVRDHGLGFPAEQAPLVFERFWRADPSRTRVLGGTGLGLAISLEDARLHNGWLSAWGRPGRGALFRLTLPRDPKRRLTGSPLPIIPVDDVQGAR